MTKRLEELFNLPPSELGLDVSNDLNNEINIEETKQTITEINNTIDKIDAALPAVRDINTSDNELDDIAKRALDGYEELSTLGMNVDSRFASEIFSVASNLLGHALTAKTAKLNKRLKIIELQLKKSKLDLDREKYENSGGDGPVETAEGQILNRNELLDRLLSNKDQTAK